MKHLIYVVPISSDNISAEISLNVKAEDLRTIMGWQTESDGVYDYLLTANQIKVIENLTSQVLPKNASLYLACDE
ncbi:DUF7683 domain-containing protein [Pseudomonas sp. SDT2931_S440]|uniref:hypothetical protein n=1 Tax=unclassified Pseudomonas TaxID=196821 RepID=UPI0015A40F6A|nr:hypothetical protein [Pseudomonas sp. A4002]NVZ94648.1 hypothetical protein [Pseudomonas sp. B6001]NWA31715.1 hypothetical protein [Pseudomonas sp. C6002]NWB14722.1 hypothetical protein [Pseudomonas sp. D6002]NWB68836.1 hypothetical protein [Pseudomonas sp. I8001]NWB80327.1 hypothetical protein [Pseudomonas sp. F9001]NWD00087.1 hypothetical protein [Pseudomonas sp. P7779]